MILNREVNGPQLFADLWRTFRCVERFDRQGIETLGFGCLTDFAVLEALRREGPMSVSGLGSSVLLTSGSITTAVDRLQKRGWVAKGKNPNDGRGVMVTLTDDGRAVVETAYQRHSENFERLFSVLEDEERSQLRLLLQKVGRHAELLS